MRKMAEQLQSTENDIIVPDELLAMFLRSDTLSVSASHPVQESVVSLTIFATCPIDHAF